jgi:hypothetical protein
VITYITASSSLTSTSDSRVLTPRSIMYVMKGMCWVCDLMGIGDTSYRYEFMWCQLSTNWFVSPRASENTLWCTQWIHSGFTIAAYDRSLNLTALNWSHIYGYLQLSCFAIYQMDSIPYHLGHNNHTFSSPQTHKVRPE